MRILFASDIHGNATCAQALVRRYTEHHATVLALLGDYMYHGPRNPLPPDYNPAEVAAVLNSVKHAIVAVRGNCDSEVDQMLCAFPILSETTIITLPPDTGNHITSRQPLSSPYRIFLAHGHRHGPGSPHPDMPPLEPGDILVRGHTHIPQAETCNERHYWNPGSAALPKGSWPASYGFYADGVFRVCALNNGQILMEDAL